MAIWQKVNCLPYIRRATSESLKDGSYILTVDKSTHTWHTPVLLLLLQQYSFGYYTCNPAGVLWYSDLSTGVLLPGTAAILFFFEEDKRQCHKDTDMGHAHCKSAALSPTKHIAKALELLGTGYNSQNCSDVLPESRKLLQQSRSRPQKNAGRGAHNGISVERGLHPPECTNIYLLLMNILNIRCPVVFSDTCP